MEAIILAGGLGTRLQGVIGSWPKCMADINGRPFLAYLFEYLAQQQCTRVILSLGYRHEVITEWLQTHTLPFIVDYVIEPEPMGTGGGILMAMKLATEEIVTVLNGDTFFNIGLNELTAFHKSNNAITSLALKEMHDFERYGVVITDKNGRITSFEEKQFRKTGMINGGIYTISRTDFLCKGLPDKCSFEHDYLQQYAGEGAIYGMACMGYFIDIGIPEDYDQAKVDFKTLFS